MRAKIQKHLDQVISHLYINPLEKCNLKCKVCYTRKTAPILSDREILEFIDRYEKVEKLQTVTFCGGEVFTLKYFPGLVNKLTSRESIQDRAPAVTILDRQTRGIFVQIITNGTIDRLDEFENPNMINLIVSLDGFKHYHDINRGTGNFEKSIGFLKKAKLLGFHIEIFSVVTHQNFSQIDKSEQYLYSILGTQLQVTYHPRKPPTYLLHHPESNVFGEVTDFDFLTDDEMLNIMQSRRTFPPKELGCYQIALVSDGRVFGCCEGTIPIGKMSDNIDYLFDKLEERIMIWEKSNMPTGGLKNCLGCSQPDFVCGIKKYLEVI